MNATRRRMLAGGLVLVLALGVMWFMFGRDGDRDSAGVAPSGVGIWRPATVEYDSTCENGRCERLPIERMHHVGGMEIFIQPDVDDAVTQWAHCIDTVVACLGRARVEDGAALSPDAVGTCVAASNCPAACKDDYARRAGQAAASARARLDVFEATFIDRGGLCVPEQGQ